MDNTSQANGLNDTINYHSDYGNDSDFSNFGNGSSFSNTPCFNPFGRYSSCEVGIIQFVVTCFLICVGLPLTFGAIYGLYSQVRNGEVAPIYVINLLISDLVQFCCMIEEVAQATGQEVSQSEWNMSMVFWYIFNYSLLASVGFMVCIALERYLFIVHPLWYRFRRTIRTSVLVCVLVWILPAAVYLTQLFPGITFSVIACIFFLLPLPLLIFFLVATLRALYASISVPTDEKRRIAGMLILVLLIYLLFFLPTIILIVFQSVDFHNPALSDLAPLFFKLSPLADLVLYILMRRGTMRQLLACVCRCRTDSNEISSVTVNEDTE
ncbi:G-protein coupled receptor 4-like [Centropristis striata]|uniref:G-protein coupled receptor 4-like n=1 Tax=Centropristis striata TaxID=184440 RepID=UPI0027E0D449|nr:G-protein coupled receptor 4-like [Centropristis striata]